MLLTVTFSVAGSCALPVSSTVDVPFSTEGAGIWSSSEGIGLLAIGARGNVGNRGFTVRGGSPARFSVGKGPIGGKFVTLCVKSGKPGLGIRLGAGMLRLGKFCNVGSPVDNGMKPGSETAGFRGTVVRVWLICGVNTGTVGKPELRALVTAGGLALRDSPDRLPSIPAVPTGNVGGEFTDDSWTSVKPSFRGLTAAPGDCPGIEIFFPSSNGRVGIR